MEVIDASGTRHSPSTPDAYARLGVGRTFQIVPAFGKLTVLEIIMIGAFLRHHAVEDARASALRVARLVGLEEVKDVEAATLPIGGLKRLEVARTSPPSPPSCMLDEVMAVRARRTPPRWCSSSARSATPASR